jgi:uncharacterized protein
MAGRMLRPLPAGRLGQSGHRRGKRSGRRQAAGIHRFRFATSRSVTIMKFLLLLVFLGIVWWAWKKRAAVPPPAARPDPQTEKMVVCAHCGVHLPESDGVAAGELHYCSEAHRQAAAAGRR